jgi:3-methyladenine DNA glycosylase AlkD
VKLDEAMAALESLGSAQTRKTWLRHGGAEPMFGVNFGPLGKLAKKAGWDLPLAEALWDTGNLDARNLALMIAPADAVSSKTLDRWAKDVKSRFLVGSVGDLAGASPFAREKADKWRASKDEWLGALGWNVVARLAMKHPDLPDAWFEERIAEIEAGIATAKNRTREFMNSALIGIGGRSAALRTKALAAAKRIGKVEVDQGDTDCKTADATQYVEKTWAYAKAKGFASPAAQEQARKRKLGDCAR